jgi:hypothetical protein
MAAEDTIPCRHSGAPADSVVQRVATVVSNLANDIQFLASKGLTAEEYQHAFPIALEKLRGSQSASNLGRRTFLAGLFTEMKARERISSFSLPHYGDDTVYRLEVPSVGSVAIIQKGCPDGKHSSVNWSRPEWANEAYLWWLCSSTNSEPGVHVWKGVNRLRNRFFSDAADQVDGVIFHNELCGTPHRLCPKSSKAISVEGRTVPPPCIYVMPNKTESSGEWNWDGRRELGFPSALCALFDIPPEQASSYVSSVGFQERAGNMRTKVSCHFGPGRSSSHRS